MTSTTPNGTSEPVYFFSVRDRVYGIFSQWQKCTFTDPNYPDIKFNTAEQYMMYGKAQTFNNQDIAAQILVAKTSKDQKALGRSVKPFSDAVWDPVKFGIVERGNYLKLSQNEKFKKALMDTGDRLLVEASKNDSIWGIGFTATTAKTVPREKWGQNLLGIALMNVRKKIRDEEVDESEEEVDESDEEVTEEEAEQPKILNSSITTRKRKHDSITEDPVEDPTELETASKKTRIDMTAEDISDSTDN